MKKGTLGVLGLSLGLGLSGPVLANESQEHERGQAVKMDELPAAARTTFEKEAKGGKVEELRKETRKDGTVFYFGEIVNEGKGTDLKVSDKGKVLHRGKAHDESSEKGEHGKGTSTP